MHEACSAQTVCDPPAPLRHASMIRSLIALWHGRLTFFSVATDRSRMDLSSAILVSESSHAPQKARLTFIAWHEPFSL